jgi:hypothetical protein
VGRVLIGCAGAVGLAGAAYFTFFAPASEGGVATTVDLMVGLWKIAVSLGMLAVALAPRLSRQHRAVGVLMLILADVAFGLVKLWAYDESSAYAFLGLDLGLLAVWAAARR